MSNIKYKKCDKCKKEVPLKESSKWIQVVLSGVDIFKSGCAYSGIFVRLDFCTFVCMREYVNCTIDELEEGRHFLKGFIVDLVRGWL